jgi:hypothetical protein
MNIIISPEACEAILKMVDPTRMTRAVLFDKIEELMKEQLNRLSENLENARCDIGKGYPSEEYLAYDNAISAYHDWEMTLKDVMISMGRQNRED